MKRCLIFNPDIRGIEISYVHHLAVYYLKHKLSCKLIFVVDPIIATQIENTEWWEEIKTSSPNNVKLIALSEEEAVRCRAKPKRSKLDTLKLGFRRWRTMMEYLKQENADIGVFMHFDHVKVFMALGLSFHGRYEIAGIEHHPVVHIERKSLSNLRRLLFYWLILRQKRLKCLLSFDPCFPDYIHHILGFKRKVLWVPDPSPLPNWAAFDEIEAPVPISIPDDRYCFLLFGALLSYKGIFQVVQSLLHLDSETSKQTAIVFAGRLSDEIRDSFKKVIKEVQNSNSSVWIHLEDRYLTEPEIVALLKRCDVVLMPYQHFGGTSGILRWAALARKPVITTDRGPLAFDVQTYRLGLCINARDPAKIAEAITYVVHKGPQNIGDTSGYRNYINAHHPDEFARAILESLCK